MPPEIEPFDLQRMFLGEASWTLLLEIAFRTSFMYLYAFALVRVVARRAIAQLSLPELLIIIALGSAVGDPMFYPEVPLLHAMVVVAVVVVLNAGLNKLVAHVQVVETLVEGRPRELIRWGRMDPAAIDAVSLAHDEFFEQLRLAGIAHLGQVRAAYLEQSGSISVFRAPPGEVRHGLPIEPPYDLDGRKPFTAADTVPAAGHYACMRDGAVVERRAGEAFGHCECEADQWVPAAPGPEEPGRPGDLDIEPAHP